ncbi:MAG: hypothetical protein KJZ64_12590 [Sphingomonadaceae bacterium]|nr:hypothetical protein [Sphingomonadaceae bacterium]
MIVAKLLLAAFFVMLGLWFWRMANRWLANSEIPQEWVELVDPKPVRRDDRYFGRTAAWQKVMALLAWFFAGLFVLSIGFELTGTLR